MKHQILVLKQEKKILTGKRLSKKINFLCIILMPSLKFIYSEIFCLISNYFCLNMPFSDPKLRYFLCLLLQNTRKMVLGCLGVGEGGEEKLGKEFMENGEKWKGIRLERSRRNKGGTGMREEWLE